jgi:hypothetical protein
MDTAAEARFIGITVEALLRPCEIYPIPTATGNGYVWQWSAIDRDRKSKCTFDLFFDCLDDARTHGYEPHFIDAQRSAEFAVVPMSASA